MMKTIIRFTSPIFLLFFLQCQTVLADDPIPEVTVVGYTGGGYSGSTDMGPMNAPGQGLNSQYSILSSYGKTKKYNDCVTTQKNATAGVLAQCNVDVSKIGVLASGSCLAGGVVIGGIAGFYASEAVIGAAVVLGYRVVGGAILGAVSSGISGCQSFASSVVGYGKDKCALANTNAIAKVCGSPPA